MHKLVRSPRARVIAGNGRQEHALAERVEQHRTPRGHRRGARNIAQQCDLAEAVAALEHTNLLAANRHIELPSRYDVEAIARLAFADDGVPGACCDRLE